MHDNDDKEHGVTQLTPDRTDLCTSSSPPYIDELQAVAPSRPSVLQDTECYRAVKRENEREAVTITAQTTNKRIQRAEKCE